MRLFTRTWRKAADRANSLIMHVCSNLTSLGRVGCTTALLTPLCPRCEAPAPPQSLSICTLPFTLCGSIETSVTIVQHRSLREFHERERCSTLFGGKKKKTASTLKVRRLQKQSKVLPAARFKTHNMRKPNRPAENVPLHWYLLAPLLHADCVQPIRAATRSRRRLRWCPN